MNPLVTALVERQQATGEADDAFAARLGVVRSYWNGVRRGTMTPGVKFLRGVRRQFPDLWREIDDFLSR